MIAVVISVIHIQNHFIFYQMILLKSGKFQITIILICKKVMAEYEKGRDGVVYMPEGLIGEKGVDLFNQRVKISPDFFLTIG